ncbi:Hint domain-containing protein [Methylobacterium frigidaeris]|uniref:Peptidase metallopeptidase domain-containing protein n=1 Tax=Methylobacterium frigidaeris TaxID=2038277 RepID=A0AA37HJG2_9HYPH|nr:Hint domain-containing protein [Methylobacterium frigidaeris]GJD66883.1 hypothetical protein MPEAHAMD_7082 [Methylobacterium frigidaeris]
MATASATTRDQEVTFISGVNADGTLAGTAFATYDGNTPDGYGRVSEQFHWGPTNAAGTGGGTLNYYFDPSANWNAGEQESLASSLSMWSAVANISFQLTSTASNANLTFSRNTQGEAFAESSSQPHAVGTSTITPPIGNNVLISMDIGDGSRPASGYGALGDFQSGGFGVGTTLHEVGHALGLGHGGPYNGTKTPDQQLGPYDNQISSIMSYFSPHGAGAYASPVGSTNWTTGGIDNYATTWMPLDIDAIQRLYGAQTNGPLNTAQTFGYNTTITGSLKPYFDFTVNTNPVLTLYGTAASGNALDLSRSNQAATLNLNSGTYSSAFGMTNNIAIYDKTYIEKVFCGAGDDVCTVNLGKNNTIDGGGGTNTAVFSGSRADYTIAQANGATIVTRTASANLAARPTGVTDTLTNFQSLRFEDQSVTVCFTAGTRIRVIRQGLPADMAIEDLQIGDQAVTTSGAPRPVRWLGHRTMACRGRKDLLPVRIAKDAFGDNRPERDLLLSPAHAVCVDVLGEVLIPACRLVNGTTVTQIPVEKVTYWHVELDSHDILFAEGLPAESYLDCGNRRFFANAGTTDLGAAPDTRPAGPLPFCRPFHEDGPLVDLVRARLGDRALALGWRLVEDPLADLHLIADGRAITADVDGLAIRFVLPAGARDVRLMSETSVPAHVLPRSTDDRRLGLPVASLTIDGARITLDDPRLGEGWQSVDGGTRWTDGSAVLPPALWEGRRGDVALRVDLSVPALPRWVAPTARSGAEAVRRRA